MGISIFFPKTWLMGDVILPKLWLPSSSGERSPSDLGKGDRHSSDSERLVVLLAATIFCGSQLLENSRKV
ncbi:MAG: hypothetical protein GDA48_03520 [Hormoscilla sp. GM102CHS1]|nr:hypothetical protein [Hormoscilla sp. GM102CHS1]